MARPNRHVVVDGSNIATEGRSLPSLAQLDEAVRAFIKDNPDATVTVIVDATFAHRIPRNERSMFAAAVDAGEIVVPPAGAVGRGDAFILQVAAKGDAQVLSNDSFQEFHGEHDWLFDKGRLVGAKPVEGIGWIFVDRVPVRGPESRRSTKAAASGARSRTAAGRAKQAEKRTPKKAKPTSEAEKSTQKAKPTSETQAEPKAGRRAKEKRAAGRADERPTKKRSGRKQRPSRATAQVDAVSPSERDGDRSSGTAELNTPSEFMSFVTRFSIGDALSGTVERFSSHGCYVRSASALCYLPVKAMGSPPPKRARDVVSVGQTVEIRVTSLDSKRRGINVELLSVPRPGGPPPTSPSAAGSGKGKQHPTSARPASVADGSAREANPTRSKTIVATKSTKKSAKKSSGRSAKKTTKKTARKSTARKSTKKAPAKKTTAKKSTAKKSTAKKSTKKAPAKKTTAKKRTTKKSTAKKSTAKKSTAKKRTTKRSTAKKSTAKKSTAKKSTKKAPAKKSTAKATPSARAQRASARKSTKKSTAKKSTKKAPAKKSTKKAPAKK